MDKKTNTLKRITTVAGVGALISIATVIYGATITYTPMTGCINLTDLNQK